VPFIFDDVDRPVGVVESLLLEARGSRPATEGRSLLGHARLDGSPEADRAWRAVRTGVTGLRLDVVDDALAAVRLVALDDADDPRTRVISTWESPDVRSG
jgi:hypothetical protein